MTSRPAHIALLSALAFAAASSAFAAGPAVVTKWRMNGAAQDLCLGYAQESLRRNGFQPLAPGSQSMMGQRGDYTAQIRCVPEQQIVFFIMSGPSPGEANRLLESVYRGWGS